MPWPASVWPPHACSVHGPETHPAALKQVQLAITMTTRSRLSLWEKDPGHGHTDPTLAAPLAPPPRAAELLQKLVLLLSVLLLPLAMRPPLCGKHIRAFKLLSLLVTVCISDMWTCNRLIDWREPLLNAASFQLNCSATTSTALPRSAKQRAFATPSSELWRSCAMATAD